MRPRPTQPPAGPPILAAEDPNTISLAAAILRAGGVVAIPTDTVYGLAASIDRPDAIDRLYHMKSRPTRKAIPILVGDLDRVSHVAMRSSPQMTVLARRFWPGALTLVVEARWGLPHQVTSTDVAGRRTVAVRLPNHPVARQIINAAGGTLAVTSANRSGETEATTARQASQVAIGEPDAIIDGGPTPGGLPSTIVSLLDSRIAILRQGAIPAIEILAVLEGSGEGPGLLPGSAV